MVECWMCSSQQDINEADFGDHICSNCGVMISIYNPNVKETPQDKPLTTHDEWMLKKEIEQKEEKVGNLKSWSKENSKFLKISSGESYEGIYQGYKEGVNMNGEPAIIYNLDGKELKSSSAKLAELFDSIAIGTKVKLGRTGEGLNTKWAVETL